MLYEYGAKSTGSMKPSPISTCTIIAIVYQNLNPDYEILTHNVANRNYSDTLICKVLYRKYKRVLNFFLGVYYAKTKITAQINFSLNKI